MVVVVVHPRTIFTSETPERVLDDLVLEVFWWSNKYTGNFNLSVIGT